MAKAAKKPAAKSAAKAAKPAAKAKPEKKAVVPKKEAAPKAAPKKEAAPKKTVEKVAPAKIAQETASVEEAAPKTKKERAAKAAHDKAVSEDLKKWSDFKDKFGSQKAAAYSMSSTYEAHQPIQHKVLGWGYILSIQNDRLEVLFESGPKMLISNYKPA